MVQWKKVKIQDIGTVVGGATPSTKIDANYKNGHISWITPKDLSTFEGRYIYTGERNITEMGLNSSSTVLMPKNSILFSSRAPIGYVAIAGKELCTNQGFKSVIPNKKIDYLFLYYLLKYNKNKIENLGSGTTFKEVSGSVMKNVEVMIPEDIKEQKRIAAVLNSIDDKIELNNEINDNLEQQLSNLFINLFAEKISNLNKESACTLGDLISVIDNRGKTPPLTSETVEYPIIDVGALKGQTRIVDFNNCTKFVSSETYNNWFRSGHPKEWDILLSTVGSLAEMKIYLGNKGCIAQNVVALRSKLISPVYLYQYLNYIRNDLIAYNIGSVQPSIKVTHIIKHPIYVPKKELLDYFDKIARPITELLFAKYNENEGLKLLRDSLLPKLMSGEIDVDSIEL